MYNRPIYVYSSMFRSSNNWRRISNSMFLLLFYSLYCPYSLTWNANVVAVYISQLFLLLKNLFTSVFLFVLFCSVLILLFFNFCFVPLCCCSSTDLLVNLNYIIFISLMCLLDFIILLGFYMMLFSGRPSHCSVYIRKWTMYLVKMNF